jgi:hypothetical protein
VQSFLRRRDLRLAIGALLVAAGAWTLYGVWSHAGHGGEAGEQGPHQHHGYH